MEKRSSRRKFLKESVVVGASAILADVLHSPLSQTLPRAWGGPAPLKVVAVTGENFYDATRKSVDALGGIHQFVSKGSVVGLLVNSVFRHPGTYAKPQIALAVVAMCHEAGAKEVVSLEDAPGSYWARAAASGVLKEYRDAIREPRGFVTREIPGGYRLKETEIRQDALECDVFINIGIAKDHEGTRFTGQLKNIMGAISGSSNRFFHSGSKAGGYYDDVDFLSACIADANRIRTPDLSINDVTEVVLTNGPFGPGKLGRHNTVVAGTDPVAVDATSASLLGLDPNQIAMIAYADRFGIGTFDRTKITVQSLKI